MNTNKVTGAHVPERKSPKVPATQLKTGSTGSITTSPSPAKNQSVAKKPDRLSKPPDMKAWRQAQESLKTIDYEKQSQSHPVQTEFLKIRKFRISEKNCKHIFQRQKLTQNTIFLPTQFSKNCKI